MNPQQPPSPPSPVIEAFGKGCGFVTAIFLTMPLYYFSYDWFYRFALVYSEHEYRWCWELIYIASLFVAIVITCWLLVSAAWGLIKLLCKSIGNLFKLLTALVLFKVG